MEKIIFITLLFFIGSLSATQELEKNLKELTTELVALEKILKQYELGEISSKQEFEILLKKATEVAQQQQKSFEEVLQFIRNINEQEKPIVIRNAFIEKANYSSDIMKELDKLNGQIDTADNALKQQFNDKIDALHTLIKNTWTTYGKEFDDLFDSVKEKLFFNQNFNDPSSPENTLKEVIGNINDDIQERNISLYNPELTRVYEELQQRSTQLAKLKLRKNKYMQYIQNMLEGKVIDETVFSEFNQQSILLRALIKEVSDVVELKGSEKLNKFFKEKIEALIKGVKETFEEISDVLEKKLKDNATNNEWDKIFHYQLQLQPQTSSVNGLLKGIQDYITLLIPN